MLDKRFIEIVTKETVPIYENFIDNHKCGHMFQTLKWANVKNPSDWEGFLCRNEKNELVGVMGVMIAHFSKDESVLYVPRGPICDIDDYDTIEALLNSCKVLLNKYPNAYIKIDSNIGYDNIDFIEFIKKNNFIIIDDDNKFTTFQSQYVYRIDLVNKSIDDIWNQFHPNIRYSIRNAIRKNVEVRVCGIENIMDFYHIMIDTGCRDRFQVRSVQYYEEILKQFKDNARLYLAYQNGLPIAGAIAVKYSKKMWYLYAGTNDFFRKLSPVTLVQWEILKWAFESGCIMYDMGGTAWLNDDDLTPGLSYYKEKMGAVRCKLTPGIEYHKDCSKE